MPFLVDRWHYGMVVRVVGNMLLPGQPPRVAVVVTKRQRFCELMLDSNVICRNIMDPTDTHHRDFET